MLSLNITAFPRRASAFSNRFRRDETEHGQSFQSAYRDSARIRQAFHFDIALPDRLRHFSLTHILADCDVAATNALLYLRGFFEVLLVSAEARRSEKKILLFFSFSSKSKVALSAVPLSVQKPINKMSDCVSAFSLTPK